MSESEIPNIGEAAARYLGQLDAARQRQARGEVIRFVRWFNAEQTMDRLRPHEVEGFAASLSATDTDNARKLEQVRAFLIYARNQTWTQNNLSVHMKLKRAPRRKTRVSATMRRRPAITLSTEGRAELEAELATLQERHPIVLAEMTRAAADKDFKENAPYHAAKEDLGHIKGRIQDIEETLKAATVLVDRKARDNRVCIGSVVCVSDEAEGQEFTYTVVDTREADPRRGKISSSSPVGQALIGRYPGCVVEVATPAGKMRYRILQIKN